MALIVQDVALELIGELRPLIPAISRHDSSLAKQLRRCASSIVLNIAEAEYSDPGTKRARFHTAAGSAGETRAALQVATCWGYVAEPRARRSLALLDRVLGMLWRLTH
jgi:four helix bundle protein